MNLRTLEFAIVKLLNSGLKIGLGLILNKSDTGLALQEEILGWHLVFTLYRHAHDQLQNKPRPIPTGEQSPSDPRNQ